MLTHIKLILLCHCYHTSAKWCSFLSSVLGCVSYSLKGCFNTMYVARLGDRLFCNLRTENVHYVCSMFVYFNYNWSALIFCSCFAFTCLSYWKLWHKKGRAWHAFPFSHLFYTYKKLAKTFDTRMPPFFGLITWHHYHDSLIKASSVTSSIILPWEVSFGSFWAHLKQVQLPNNPYSVSVNISNES